MDGDARRRRRLAAGRVLIGVLAVLTVAYAVVMVVSDGPDEWWVLGLGVAGLVASVAAYAAVRRGGGPTFMR
ncbi:hypothetical protein AB6N23_05440 [Cellulomonas sp. 179-A 9B4 NHS]|uniref:hypothetical protein n=1 Tax=Cellulomonas sp. 179-A 9B4 NHS TaxID=3142379 RepID=UPI0039A3C949